MPPPPPHPQRLRSWEHNKLFTVFDLITVCNKSVNSFYCGSLSSHEGSMPGFAVRLITVALREIILGI